MKNHRWPKPKLQRQDKKGKVLLAQIRTMTKSFFWDADPQQGHWWGRNEEFRRWLLQQCLSNNEMTGVWLFSNPEQKLFCTSNFTESCRSNLLSIQIYKTLGANKDSSQKPERTLTPAQVCVHICVRASVWVYVGQRLNKGGKWVRLTLLLSLNTQTDTQLL